MPAIERVIPLVGHLPAPDPRRADAASARARGLSLIALAGVARLR